MKRFLGIPAATVLALALLPMSAAVAEEPNASIEVPSAVTDAVQPGSKAREAIVGLLDLKPGAEITFGTIHEFGCLDVINMADSGPITEEDCVQPGEDWIVPVYVDGTWVAMAQIAGDGHLAALGPIVGWDARDAELLDSLPETSLIVGAGELNGTFVVSPDGENLAPLDATGEGLAGADLEMPAVAEEILPDTEIVSSDDLRQTIETEVEELQAEAAQNPEQLVGGVGGANEQSVANEVSVTQPGTNMSVGVAIWPWLLVGALLLAGTILISRGIVLRRRKAQSL